MKQRIFILNALLCLVLSVWAVPAKRGVWCTLSLVDGTEVKAQLVGDEFLHYYVSEDGTKYVQDEATGLYRKMTDEVTAQRRAAVRRAQAQGRQKRMLRKAQASNVFQGTKKGLVILAEFTNSKFKSGHDLALYRRIANEVNYSDNNFRGSIKDYFKAQSHGQFELDFDVAGICQLQHPYAYYGKNNSQKEDVKPGEMVAEACLWAHEHGINFSKYDWNGDGEVDQVFVLYAGHGEASYKDANTIWPHMYYLSASDYGKPLSLDGVTVDTYACSSELNGDGNLDGIGTFCHEFSHCMGFPDLYDTSYAGWFGMGDFDLMCSGSYNGDSKCPAGYSAYEKAECGWLTLKDMTDVEKETSIAGVQPMSADGDAYVIKNKGHEDEYYILENRQKTGWDSYLPASGLMITHVDYDADIWGWNMPNTSGKYEDANGNTKTNDHQRLTIFRAGKSTDEYGDASDLYPYGSNNSLTKTSSPASTLYNTNSDGSKYMHVAITDIAIAADGTASFTLSKEEHQGGDVPVTPSGSTMLYESFDKCTGTGGNDSIWGGRSIGAGTPTYDNKGWTSTQGKVYASSACVRVGTSSVNGDITTPSFTVNGKAVLSFKAGAWNTSGDGTTLNLSVSNGTISPSSVTMKKGEWTDYNVTITANGNVKTTFKASKLRFFLDEVKVTDASTSGIREIEGSRSSSIVAYYTLGGIQVTVPSSGIYLARYADGTIKKVVIR
uniref:M6 family metalloprotease domain-containing protein n=1 Tax=Prevotella sp. TaxID=59823 RepID=UPI004026E1BD